MSFVALAKPVGDGCNVDCSYCFHKGHGSRGPCMSDEVMHAYVDQATEAGVVMWQGGEPTLAGLDFYRRVVARLAGKPRVVHAIQTNATLVDEEWAAFFADSGMLVGVSLDGPQDLHDANRRSYEDRGTYRAVRAGLDRLRRAKAEVNVLCTVNASNASSPLRVYRHLRDDIGARHIQFIPVTKRGADSVSARAWGEFLVAVFDEWEKRDLGTVFVSVIEHTFATILGAPGSCLTEAACGRCPAVDRNGDVYSCDHFFEPRDLLGNVLRDRIVDLLDTPKQRAFGEAKRAALPSICQRCDVLDLCRGECPKNRDEGGLNFLCAGYLRFYRHARPQLEALARRGTSR